MKTTNSRDWPLVGFLPCIVLAIFTLLISACQPKQEKKANETAVAKLVGKWQMVDEDDPDGKISKEDLESASVVLVFSKDSVTFFEHKEKQMVLGFKISTAKEPHSIDFLYPKDKANHAIFSLKDDQLVICSTNNYDANHAYNRPLEISVKSPKNKGLVAVTVQTFQRVKEK